MPTRTRLLAFLLLTVLIPRSTARAVEPSVANADAKAARDVEGEEFFEKKIRPMLVQHCYACHGKGQNKGGLNLDSRDKTMIGGESGKKGMVPGKPDESLLIAAVTYEGDVQMPPKGKLTSEEIADLSLWVKKGAPWPHDVAASTGGQFRTGGSSVTAAERAFWSFQPVKDSPPPEVRDTAWPRKPLDRFVLARLEAEGLKPAGLAEKRTLLRRVTFDLIGLPPTPEEIDAFVVDDTPEALARVVDRLLASPHYGERWGRHWLDVARYAEDQAHTFSARLYPQGYRYRDWVVKSFNDDLPYDRFLQEQIAGDLLDKELASTDEGQAARMARLPALGFFALGPVYYKNTDKGKAEADELDDRIDTLTRGMLGLTVSCARCHDHKFDPIPTADYYSLAGIFNSTNYQETPLAPPAAVAEFNKAQAHINEQDKIIQAWLANQGKELGETLAAGSSRYLVAAWQVQNRRKTNPKLAAAEVAKAAGLHDSLLDAWIKYLPSADKRPYWSAWSELAALEDKSIDHSQDPEWLAAATYAAEQFEQQALVAIAQRRLLEEAKAIAKGNEGKPEAEKKPVPKPTALTKEQNDQLNDLFGQEKRLFHFPADRVEKYLHESRKPELMALRKELEQRKAGLPPKYPQAHALTEGNPANMKVFVRGNPTVHGDVAPRQFLAILSDQDRKPFQQGSGRLELAKSIASPENPLTARVLVNRVWAQHFGRGLVGTPSNFGMLGERPTHPELLDHLTAGFIAHGWSIKWLHREILLSTTYQLASAFDVKNFEKDPDNKLLWRANRRRLDVESWRDGLLAVSGQLEPKLGGPSINLNADNRRRTVYGSVSRHELNGLLRLFDFPDPNITSEKRTITTVPLQQLFVLNSDFMVKQSKALAARLKDEPDDAARIRRVYALTYGRLPAEREQTRIQEFLSAPEVNDDAGKPVAVGLSRWEQLAQALLAANEFAFVD